MADDVALVGELAAALGPEAAPAGPAAGPAAAEEPVVIILFSYKWLNKFLKIMLFYAMINKSHFSN